MTPQVLALIPARGGSKSIPRKNIKLMAGIPLIAYSIVAALAAETVNRVVVSTDDREIAEVARKWGAETPFMRPSEIAGDHSTDLDVFQHALRWFAEHENYHPDICVHLRPTYPVRERGDIDQVVTKLLDNPDVDAVRSVALAPETPFKMWFLGDDQRLSPVVECDIPEAYNQPRQILPRVYLQNACIDAVRTRVITTKNSMTGSSIMGVVMDHNYDIDTEEQFRHVEQELILRQLHLSAGIQQRVKASDWKKTFCFDIDGVIATLVPISRYDQAQPQRGTIELINHLYDLGHRIILFTARGSATGMDWSEVTRKQMNDWGVKYHELLFGKPAADYHIDDKLITIEQLGMLIGDWE